MRKAPLQASQPLHYDIPRPTTKHSEQKGSQNEMSSLTSSPTPQLLHTPIHLKKQWKKGSQNNKGLPYKLPNPLITIYHNPLQNKVSKKAPKMKRAPLQAPHPSNYHLPQSTLNHSGQKGSQNDMSSLTSFPTP